MRVLLVEDELPIADFIARGLTENGYSVDVAHDGGEAVHWPSVAEFDVIILDVMLPGRDGMEVCRILRRQGVWAGFHLHSPAATLKSIASSPLHLGALASNRR